MDRSNPRIIAVCVVIVGLCNTRVNIISSTPEFQRLRWMLAVNSWRVVLATV